ncbi:hypothetical protein D3C81_1402150 [compost metagenome]
MEVLDAAAVLDIGDKGFMHAQGIVHLGEGRAHVIGDTGGAVDGVSLVQCIARPTQGTGSGVVGRTTTQAKSGIRALLVHAGIEVGHFGVGRGQLRAVDGIGTAGADTASGHVGDGAVGGAIAHAHRSDRSTAGIGISGARDSAGSGGHDGSSG